MPPTAVRLLLICLLIGWARAANEGEKPLDGMRSTSQGETLLRSINATSEEEEEGSGGGIEILERRINRSGDPDMEINYSEEESEEDIEPIDRMIDEKAGPITENPTVVCGRYTSKTVVVGALTEAEFITSKETRRCTVLYKMDATCTQMNMVCPKFYVDNHDPYKCRRGDFFTTKCKEGKPHFFCKDEGPNDNYPVLCEGNLKATYVAEGGKRYPEKGVNCIIKCAKPV